MTREEKIRLFDVNQLSIHNQLFGLPFTIEESEIVVIPVPWEVTVSYGSGTIDGPAMAFEASKQVDIFHPKYPEHWKRGIAFVDEPNHIRTLSDKLRPLAEKRINALENQADTSIEELAAIEKGCVLMIDWVEKTAKKYIDKGKKVLLLGGDHSTPLGLIKAISEQNDDLGVLQIDAHADLRVAYEGFTYSHASIMHNVLKETSITKLVQLGIRDYCQSEYKYIKDDNRIVTFFDRDIQSRLMAGETWKAIVDEVVAALPKNVYISFDVDGMQPVFCPNTGTPVYGGYTPQQIIFLVEQIKASGRIIKSFDINEIGPDELDANVASRLLWELSALL
ncbi:MAG: agmatinase family protein [Cryomorphaceae bacterium]|nr:agmatinase family protein [Cryomorphaceae bacterium]